MRKKMTRSSQDRLSNLPEDVLCRIISFMGKVREACRTSILSRYWRPLWTMLPDVYFHYDSTTINDSPQSFQCFERFVNKVLDSRKALRLGTRKLKFHMLFHSTSILDPCRLSTWIRGAIECHVEMLDVEVVFNPIPDENVVVPLSVFTSDTIRFLRLHGNLSFTPSSSSSSSPAWLPSLKTLVLCAWYNSDELVPCLLCACPYLEEFDVYGTYKAMEIRAPKLKSLSGRFQRDSRTSSFEIDAPSLESLSIRDFHPTKYVIKNLDNVMRAQLTIMVLWRDRRCLFSLFKALSNVKSLSLCIVRSEQGDGDGYWLDGDFEDSIEELYDRYLPRFPNLVHLQFDEICDLALRPSFLRKSPKLEGLVIERHEDADALWAKPQEVPSCLSSHLTHFTYKGFLAKEDEFKTVAYFVRNSSVLKTVTIQPSMSVTKMMPKVRRRIYAKLEAIPRGSISCELIFEQKPYRSYDHDWIKRFYIFG